jgi:hypothetical protein
MRQQPRAPDSFAEFAFLPGVFVPLRRLAESGLAVVTSNQSAVAAAGWSRGASWARSTGG